MIKFMFLFVIFLANYSFATTLLSEEAIRKEISKLKTSKLISVCELGNSITVSIDKSKKLKEYKFKYASNFLYVSEKLCDPGKSISMGTESSTCNKSVLCWSKVQ